MMFKTKAINHWDFKGGDGISKLWRLQKKPIFNKG